MPNKTTAPIVWEIKKTQAAALVATENTATIADDLNTYLETAAKSHDLRYLLAFADDGVVWGRIEEKTGTLITAPRISPPLLASTLQSARLFGETAELLVWRGENGSFVARVLRDVAPDETAPKDAYTESINEDLFLWGDHVEAQQEGFTVWREGAEGLRHAVPFAAAGKPPRLRVRHYLAPNESMARIAVSRLVGLSADTQESKPLQETAP